MTEQIKSAIEYLEDVIEIVHRSKPDGECSEVKMAIRSLKAWEEVLQELETLIRGCDIMLEDNNEDMFYGGKKRGYEKAIEVINQKLKQIEE